MDALKLKISPILFNIMRKFTDKEILDRVKSLPSFRGFPVGVMDVWVRSKADEFDKFDDVCFTYECYGDEKEPRFIMRATGTTNAGAVGLKHFAKYNSLGCAVLKADEIVYNSHNYGLHKGKYPAYRQAKGFPYHRDNDCDNKAEELGRVYYDIIFANCHTVGNNAVSYRIGGWSVACLVRQYNADHQAWLRFMNRRPLTVCILNEF
jgi:hypothetical protein